MTDTEYTAWFRTELAPFATLSDWLLAEGIHAPDWTDR